MCRHQHIPLQSGCDTVLERMRRRYTTAEYRRIVEEAREQISDLAITTDIIVGFPGETDAEFAETMQFVEEMAFSRLHVFRYSRRTGTPAARFPNQIPATVKEERSHSLISLGEKLAEQFHQAYVGKKLEVLVEQVEDGHGVGLTDNYIRVEFASASDSLVEKQSKFWERRPVRKGFSVGLLIEQQVVCCEGGVRVSQDCLFCRIAAGEIPSDKVFENERIFAFRDINPVAPVHILVIPKEHIDSIAHVEDDHQALLGEIMTVIRDLAHEENLEKGYRVVANISTHGGQTVPPSFPSYGGRGLQWPPG